jgi:hypothetical protein
MHAEVQANVLDVSTSEDATKLMQQRAQVIKDTSTTISALLKASSAHVAVHLLYQLAQNLLGHLAKNSAQELMGHTEVIEDLHELRTSMN